MGPVEEERSPDEDADALRASEIKENKRDKTKLSVSKPAENDNKPENIAISLSSPIYHHLLWENSPQYSESIVRWQDIKHYKSSILSDTSHISENTQQTYFPLLNL